MKSIYLAGPFFNAQQVAVIELLERTIAHSGYAVLSPRKMGGVLMAMTKEQRAAATEAVFKMNVDAITSCDLVLAVIDGRDTGTIWEIGFAFGIGKRIVTYTDHHYGLNVMIQKCVSAHCKGVAMLGRLLALPDLEALPAEFLNFHEGVY